ncbi:MAG: hypothetical protein ABFD77_10255 [Thermotogota bacterium]
MKQYRCRLATTHVDLDGDRLALSGLEAMVRQIDAQHIPVGVEHDPRIPPAGRIASAELVELTDGDYAVDGVIEVFEAGDRPALETAKGCMPLQLTPSGKFAVLFDRGFRDEESRALVDAVGTALGVQPRPYIKKSLDPISVLTIGVGFALGAVATGFLRQLGEDSYATLKGRLAELFARQTGRREGTSILSLDVTVEKDGKRMVIQVLAENPGKGEIDALLGDGLAQVDAISERFFATAEDVPKLVCRLQDGRVTPTFGVRRDCVPLSPADNPSEEGTPPE